MATGRIPTTANSPLTAKGDLFTFSTGSAKLAVGSNGDTLVADSAATTGLRWQGNYSAGKNKIINGDFNINQRSFSSSTTDGSYGFDRWLMEASGGATYSAQTFTAGTAPVAGYEAKNFAQIATTGQSGAGVYTLLEQKIESVRTFAGQTVTLSFWAKASSGTPQIGLELSQSFGSGGSSQVNTQLGAVTLSTSWARYSLSVAVPSISGKTIGTADSLTVGLWTSAGTTFATRASSIGIQTATIQIWGVQLEEGSVATAFQTATGTLQGELAACQRYFQRFTAANPAVGFAGSTTVAQFSLNYKVPLRNTTLSLAQSGMVLWDVTTVYSGGTWAIAASSTDASGISFSRITYTHGTGALTQFRPYLMINNDGNSYVEVSAEL
jgi:predicted secreted protein